MSTTSSAGSTSYVFSLGLLQRQPSDLVGGQWKPLSAGNGITSIDPAEPRYTLWQADPSLANLDEALEAARNALPVWAGWSREQRCAVLKTYADICTKRQTQIAELISRETGKALWDATAEAGGLAAKVAITLDDSQYGAMSRVTDYELALTDSRTGRTWYKPHGVMAVVAPFNFPAHLANGHIVPALVMGNTIVLKPSERTPATGQMLAELFHEALQAHHAPPGVVNVVQGAVETAKRIVSDSRVDGVLFTGSWNVGRRILEANLDHPSKMIALEMGGNNPAVVMPDANMRQAAIECARAAFVTTGQRCTCTRRLIIHKDIAETFIGAVAKAASNVIIGHPRAEHPVFIGPIISAHAREAVLKFQQDLVDGGGEIIAEATGIETLDHGFYVSPGMVQVDHFVADDAGGPASHPGCDMEVFGPMLRVCIVDSLDDAIEQANATRYGLAASIFTSNMNDAKRFLHEVRAGCINVNTGTAGASSKLPFGGLGLSGNHRPAGSFSLDYCAYPVAGMIEQGEGVALPQGMRFEDAWVK
ncbi:MAG: aldehyde dehydrogenase family protein [Phycisphaeraceae bacterium]|nr:aldehyde dehydrogenase family protein [Phycisphaerales bacterium]MCB9858850.1 aldehyde dehydrogenase family protein [Phycisphaeraceae bacterium]